MNILLISPLDPKVPTNLNFLMGGENTFTQTLLANPPKDVVYTHHTEALRKGEIVYLPIQKILSFLIKFRIFPLDSGYHCIKLTKQFDLIYCHGYNLFLLGDIKPPVLLGDSSSNYLFLRDYLGWSEMRIRLPYFIRRYVHKYLGVFDRDLNLQDAYKLIVFSEFAKSIHGKLGENPGKIAVVYPGVPERKIKKKKQTKQVNILFAGVWFERKGGGVLVKAYEVLKKKYPDIHLILLGPLPKNISINRKEVTQVDFVSYDRLLNEFYPSADIFVLVPPLAEGFGLVSVEAASFGIPTIVSNVYALPEIVVHGKTGFIVRPGDVDDLVTALEKLIVNPKLRKEMGEAARKRFKEKFAVEVMNKQLKKIYKEATK